MKALVNVYENPWSRFALRRLVSLAAMLVFLVVATFVLVHLIPGDPARQVAGIQATPQEVAQMRHDLGLDNSIFTQFDTYTSRLAHLQLGNSFVTSEPVTTVLRERYPSTLQLALIAVLITMCASLSLGMLAAMFTREHRHPKIELAITGITSAGGAVPSFVAATFLVFIFAIELSWLPVAGKAGWQSFILPALAVSIAPTLVVTRIVRVETLNVLSQEYIRVARSKRLSTPVLYLRHVLPNVLTSALTIGGLIFASLLGGTVVVENVFAWPGLGTTVVQSVLVGDYPVVQGATLLFGLTVAVAYAVIDATLVLVNRRSLVATT